MSSRSLFFTASISHFVTAATQNFHVSFGFLSLALNPCHPFSR